MSTPSVQMAPFLTSDLDRMVDREFLGRTARKKELIIRGGVNIAPKEIEDLLISHPAVREVAVVGVPGRAQPREKSRKLN